MQNRRKQKYC